MTTTTYTIEDSGWDGASIFAWDADGYGTEIGRAHFTNEISNPMSRASVRLDNGNFSSNFASPAEILAWVAKNA